MKEKNIINKESKNKETDFTKNLDAADLKTLQELKSIIAMFKNPFWKFVLCIVVIGSLLNICYGLGWLIGELLAKL